MKIEGIGYGRSLDQFHFQDLLSSASMAFCKFKLCHSWSLSVSTIRLPQNFACKATRKILGMEHDRLGGKCRGKFRRFLGVRAVLHGGLRGERRPIQLEKETIEELQLTTQASLSLYRGESTFKIQKKYVMVRFHVIAPAKRVPEVIAATKAHRHRI